MKKIFTAIVAAATLMTAVSCEDFLTTNPTSSVSDSSVFTSTSGAQAALSGCYNLLSFGYGGSRPDTQGYISHMLSNDVCGNDIVVIGGWYCYDYDMYGHQRNDLFKTSGIWYYYYVLINNLNSVIAYTPEIEDGLESTKNEILGQAYAMRGWAYFQLAQTYQHTYHLSSPRGMQGVPIYTEPSTDQTEGKARGTIDDTYDQILSDLTTAEGLLDGFTRTQKNHFDLTVVQGILARVYLVMEDWEKAEDYASKVLDKYPLTTNEQWQEGFNDSGTDSWVWAMEMDSEHNTEANGDYGPFAMWTNYITRGNDDLGLWSFNCFFVDTDFVDLFEESDIRYQFHYNSDYTVYYSDKFYDITSLGGDFVFMRADEMLLNKAEALVQQNKDSEGRALLNELQELRGATLSDKSGSALIDDILVERRKELYGEGFALYDNLRSEKGISSSSQSHDLNTGGVPVPANSWRLIYQIPSDEIVNNPNISSDIWPSGDQNPWGDASAYILE